MDFGHVSNTEQIFFLLATMLGFPGGASGKETSYHAGDIRDVGSIPGSGRSPGGGHGNQLQSFLPGESHTERSLGGYHP